MTICSLVAEDLRKEAKELKAGQKVLLSGVVYTARDAANTVRVILAVYESAAAGRTVTPDA